VTPAILLKIKPELMAELNQLATENRGKIFWSEEEYAVLKHYLGFGTNIGTIAEIMGRVFPGKRTYTRSSVDTAIRRGGLR
jgi:hypothetical protein